MPSLSLSLISLLLSLLRVLHIAPTADAPFSDFPMLLAARALRQPAAAAVPSRRWCRATQARRCAMCSSAANEDTGKFPIPTYVLSFDILDIFRRRSG